MESQNERFRRLADSRAERIRREISLASNLTDTSLYEYDRDDISALFGPIEKSLAELRALFEKNLPKDHLN